MERVHDFGGRILRENSVSWIPQRVLYLDTETEKTIIDNETIHTMKLAWSCLTEYGPDVVPLKEDWKYWNDTAKFWSYVQQHCQPKRPMFLIAHNVFFDLQASGFFHWFAKWKWQLRFLWDKGLTYILIAVKDECTIKCISSTNFYECSLAELGQMVGVEKSQVDFDAVDTDTLSSYCRRDVEILKLGIEKYFVWLQSNDMGKFSLSKASQSMHAYRHRFMKTKITYHQDENIRKLERDSYFGGRCECFQMGEISNGPFVTLDVNSQYPYVMQKYPVPIRLVDYEKQISLGDIDDTLKSFCVVARASLDCDLPLFAVRRDKKIIFPVGKFDTVLTTGGIKEALARGYVQKIGETAIYEKAVIFTEFVSALNVLKERYTRENKLTERYLVKKMLNSLYGKWAQRQIITEEDILLECEGYFREEVLDLVTGQMEIVSQLLNKRIVQFGEEEMEKSFTAISAHITEYARMHLWRLIEPLYPDHILYCDTDSLKIRESDLGLVTAPISDTELGALKIENTVDTLQIFGPKAYHSDGKRTIKGVKKSAIQISPISYRYDSFLRQASHLKRHMDTGVIQREVIKTLSGNYDKGIVQPNGSVLPFRL